MNKKLVLKSLSTVQKKDWAFKISAIDNQILVVAFNMESEEVHIKIFFSNHSCIAFMESLING